VHISQYPNRVRLYGVRYDGYPKKQIINHTSYSSSQKHQVSVKCSSFSVMNNTRRVVLQLASLLVMQILPVVYFNHTLSRNGPIAYSRY
jgi:hypothetical protein